MYRTDGFMYQARPTMHVCYAKYCINMHIWLHMWKFNRIGKIDAILLSWTNMPYAEMGNRRMQSGSRCQALINTKFLATQECFQVPKMNPPFVLVLNMQWCRKKQVRWSTSTCSGGSGIPMERITFWGRGFLQRDQRKTSVIILSPSFFSPFVECKRWFWDFSVSVSCDSDAGTALTIFSPAKESSYLQITTQKIRKYKPSPRYCHMYFRDSNIQKIILIWGYKSFSSYTNKWQETLIQVTSFIHNRYEMRKSYQLIKKKKKNWESCTPRPTGTSRMQNFKAICSSS